MTRDEIYDHLAKVYLGKRESVIETKPLRKKSHVWLVINVVITSFILASVVYGLTAFLTKRNDLLKSRVIYSLNNSPIRLFYSVGGDYPQVKDLTIPLPVVDVSKFSRINLSLKGMPNGNPGMLKVVLTNEREEKASYYLQGIKTRWQDYSISFDELNLTDWKSLKDISFVVEAWNAEQLNGSVLVDNISFSN
ncbi:MAG: hypothetical protein HQL16_04655 [Candidatus Omnitrophica bacterium]|nr:hypothetical protein [Candidatus Omnitrophota bacterium]